MNATRTEYKKQALEYIISMYLTRRNNEDIEFIHKNMNSTQELVNNVGSSMMRGLDRPSLIINESIYGQNNKRANMGEPLTHVLGEEVMNYRFIGLVLLSICCMLTGQLLQRYELSRDGLWIAVFVISFTLIKIAVWYKTQSDLYKFSKEKDKTDVYRVIRDGKSVQVPQQKLVTGDIVELGFKEKIPASGLLVSSKEILVNEQILGHKIERKMSLENCLSYIESMSNLELKLAFQNSQLPSPVVIRGTEVIYGCGKMIILALQQEELVKKYQPESGKRIGCKKLQQWCDNLIKKWSKINMIYAVLLFTLIIGLFVTRKWLRRETLSFPTLFTEIVKILQIPLGAIMLFSPHSLAIFLKVRLLKFMMLIRQPENFRKVLTASQLLVTEENIVRYDEIKVQKIASFEKREIIDISEVSTLSESQIEIFNETINGVMLKSPFDTNKRQTGQFSNNQVMHTYKTYDRIVTSFEQDEYQQRLKISDNRALFQMNPKPAQPVVEVSKNELELITAIRSTCKYTTERILSGLMQIAEKKCKTYYYKKFTQEELKSVHFVHLNGKRTEITKQQKEKMKMMARKIIIDNLIPIMLGYSEGFDSQIQMSVIVGIIGINKQCENRAVEMLKRLEDIGIKSVVLIPHEPDSERMNLKQLVLEYEGKDWLHFREEQTVEMSYLRKSSGRLICGTCLIANCDCKNRLEEVSNILKFMKLTNAVKVIYGVTSETDIYYLECAFSQLRQTCISITNHHAKTVQSINDIFQGYKMIEKIEKGVLYFLFTGFITTFCIGLFAVLEANIFFGRQMMAFLILSHGLPLFGFTAEMSEEVKKIARRNRRIMTIYSRFSTLFLIILCLISVGMVLFLYFYPYFVPEEPQSNLVYSQIQQLNPRCPYTISDRLIPAFAADYCIMPNAVPERLHQPYLIYSRHSTFMFNFLFNLLFIFYTLVLKNWKSIRTLISYISIVFFYFLGLLLSSSAYQIHFQSITLVQYFIGLGLAIGTLGLSYLLSLLLTNWTESLNKEFEFSLDFDESGPKHYSAVLKKYLNYSDEIILMRREDD